MINWVGDKSAQVVAVFADIGQTRMADLPIYHDALQVEAIGFREWAHQQALGCAGVLITPWCMNLIWLPQEYKKEKQVGIKHIIDLPAGDCEFFTAYEPALGTYLTSSLFSPMFEFSEMQAARDVAWSVMDSLFKTTLTAEEQAKIQTPEPMDRRAFFRKIASPVEANKVAR